ncbi:hypothetical protein LSAT2_002886 [Lamellibrachia satsuma]|nr:hypothetical protein LSAT2_002886 [Lamellibrachia satsuma]
MSSSSDNLVIHPAQYKATMRCRWKIIVKSHQIIKLEFVRFDVDNWAKYPTRPVNVYDGATSTSPRLGTFGGSTLPSTIISSSNTLFVSFESYFEYHHCNLSGFEIKYIALEFNNGGLVAKLPFKPDRPQTDSSGTLLWKPYVPLEARRGQKACNDNGASLIRDEGKIWITAPLYKNNLYCQWHIKVGVGKRVLLHFERFDVEHSSGCSKDNVTLTDTATGIELFTLCDHQLPDDVMSSNNEMTVVFATDSSVTAEGFLISYVASSEVYGCSANTAILASSYGILDIDPAQYKATMRCRWNIAVESNKIIKLDFVRFDVDNWAKYPTRPVNVYDGATSTSPRLGTFGGSTLPSTIISSSNTLFVSFESYYEYHYCNLSGFEIQYTAVEFNNEACNGSGATLNEAEGKVWITAPFYKNNLYCQWHIKVEVGKRVLLRFERFDVQETSGCSNDNVTLTDTATGIELFTLCGHQLPDDVVSSSNEMTVVFATDNSVTTNGFAIFYVASSEVFEACNGTGIKLKGDKGLIWMTAKLYKNDIHCQWHINVDVEKRVFLHFETFDVQDSSGCSNDNVTLTDTVTGIELFTLCGHQLPNDVMSSSNEMTIVFASDSSVTTKGICHLIRGFLCSIRSNGKIAIESAQYKRTMRCRWKIVVESNKIIKLDFVRFDVDNWAKYPTRPINVYDGPTSSSALLGKFGGRTMPNTIFSSDNTLTVSFESHNEYHRNNLNGFEIVYTSLDFNYDACNGTGATLSGDEGYVWMSASLYKDNIYCRWQINVNVAKRVLLQFKQFDVQDISSCSKDNVTLTDTATGIELFTLCGHQLPDDVLSSSNEMTVVFATDNSVTTNGFFISYVASSEVFGCSDNTAILSSSNGTVAIDSAEYKSTMRCRWKIVVDLTKIIKLDFVKFEVDNWAKYPTRPVNIYDGATSTSPRLGKFGGSTLPSTIFSSNNTLFVTYDSCHKCHRSNMNGFEIKYTALEFKYVCSNDDDCGDHGTCNMSDHKCSCTDGYSGNTCQTRYTCSTDEGCGDHGTCNTTDHTCSCADGYSGNKCQTQSEMCSAANDLVFVIDSSASIEFAQAGNWDRLLRFVNNIVAKRDIGMDATRVGVVRFSTDVVNSVYLDQYYNKDELMNAISNIRFKGRSTFTAGEAQKAQQQGIDVYSIGITDKVDVNEVRDISSPPHELNKNYFLVTDFSNLDEIVQAIFNATCGDVVQTTTTMTTNPPPAACSNDDDCGGHGSCNMTDHTCSCADGYSGNKCQTHYICSTDGDCGDHGMCNTTDHTCSCTDGYSGNKCQIQSNATDEDCSDHGTCNTTDRTCSCADGYSGNKCQTQSACSSDEDCGDHGTCNTTDHTCSCANGYIGNKCQTQSGQSECDGPNWSESRCSIKVLHVAPDQGPDVGNTTLHVFGRNFPNRTTYRCRFGTTTVPARWINKENIVCTTPAHSAGSVVLEISPSVGVAFTNDQATFNYYALCPEDACGSLKTPRRGICSTGRCLCSTPWLGDNCEILGLAPKITPVPQQTVVEGTTFRKALTTSEGTKPLTWILVSAPSGMDIDVVKVGITWTAVARNDAYTVVVKVTNSIGADNMTFDIVVRPSYKAVLDPVPSGPFLRALPVMISGKVVFLVSNSSLMGTDIPVSITIKSAVGLRTVQATTLYGTEVFHKRFYPYSSETGLFEVDARHPADEGFEAQLTWRVYGLSIWSSPASLSGYLDTYHLSLNIMNTGVDPLTGLVIRNVIAPFAVTLEEQATRQTCPLHLTSCPVDTALMPGSDVRYNISIVADQPVSGYFRVVVTCTEGLARYVDIHGNFNLRKPKFAVTPSSISASLTRGKRYTFVVNVTNVGLRPATGMRVELPNEPLLSLVSFGSTVEDSERDGSLTLAPGDSAVLVLAASTSERQPLGRRSGTLVVRSLQIDAGISYSFLLVSSDKLDLTVRVEDEFTYFADGRPLLAGAKVTLRSRLRSVSITQNTNGSGIAVFSDIKEDYYSLYTSATKHTGDTRVILATPSDNDVRVFLQRTAVTYSWVVKRVTFKDVYKVTLKATFETNVPMPVVTITPQELDLDVLQRGLMPVINFELTNHGLIRAEDVKFRLPSSNSHPFMHFEMDASELGSIEANTTMLVPVHVVIDDVKKHRYIAKHGTISKRSNPLACVIITLYAAYAYICERARYNELAVPINNALSDACALDIAPVTSVAPVTTVTPFYIPLPIGLWRRRDGDSKFMASSSRDVIPVTTELTCDKCLVAVLGCYSKVISILTCVTNVPNLTPPFEYGTYMPATIDCVVAVTILGTEKDRSPSQLGRYVRETGNQLIFMKKDYHLSTCLEVSIFCEETEFLLKIWLNIIIVIPSELFALRGDIAVGERNFGQHPETFINIRVGGLPFLDFGE